MDKQEYRVELDQVQSEVDDGLDADTAYRRRLALILALFISEGGTREEFLDLLTQHDLLSF